MELPIWQDSLAAIKKCVYDEKTISRDALWTALLNNFDGAEGEKIQKLLLAAPKYGNDDDYVDLLGREAYCSYIDEVVKYPNTRFGRGTDRGNTLWPGPPLFQPM